MQDMGGLAGIERHIAGINSYDRLCTHPFNADDLARSSAGLDGMPHGIDGILGFAVYHQRSIERADQLCAVFTGYAHTVGGSDVATNHIRLAIGRHNLTHCAINEAKRASRVNSDAGSTTTTTRTTTAA